MELPVLISMYIFFQNAFPCRPVFTITAIGKRMALFKTQIRDLHWERTFTSNVGLDFAMWNGRFEGSLDYYEKTTKDIIYGYTVDPSLYPVSSMTANVGEMSNKGIELVLSGTPIQKTHFKWHTSFNISHNRNKVVSLSNDLFQKDNVLMTEAVGNGQSGVTIQILKAGMPIGQFYTFKYAGKNEEGVSSIMTMKEMLRLI